MVSGKRVVLALAAAIIMLAPMAVEAAIINVSSGDWSGSRSSADGLLETAGQWSEPDNNGIEFHWEITFDGGLYSYMYSFTGAVNNDLTPAVSHWILQVTDPSVREDFINLNVDISEESPSLFVQDSGNPDMPGPLYGVKFDLVPEGLIYTFQTVREPVWGDLYIKDGKRGSVFTTAWNTGFGTEPGLDTTNFEPWIPRPDGGTSQVPVPPSVLLLGGGLLALVGLRKRQNRIS